MIEEMYKQDNVLTASRTASSATGCPRQGAPFSRIGAHYPDDNDRERKCTACVDDFLDNFAEVSHDPVGEK